VPKEGYFLDKLRFVQVRLCMIKTLSTNHQPKLKSIGVMPSIIVSDIYPNKSRPVYVRSNIPYSENFSYFNSRIRTWWITQ
jgi:hypothetical protein